MTKKPAEVDRFPQVVMMVVVMIVLSVLQNAVKAQTTFDVTVLAGACANCHGTDGRSPGGIPSLAGQPEALLKSQMLAYKSDVSPATTTIMNRLAKGYSDEEIGALALYFSQISPRPAMSKQGVR